MKPTEIFADYAAAFEKTMLDDNWSRLENYFADDAEYVPGDGRYGFGPRGVAMTLKEGVDALDRQFDERKLVEMAISAKGDSVALSFRAAYKMAGLPALELWGEEHAEVRDGKIFKLEDQIAPDALAGMENWFAKYGEQLAGSETKQARAL